MAEAEDTGWRGKKEKKGTCQAEGARNAAEGTGWQKQKRKDWNLMAPEGTGYDGRGGRDRMDDGRDGRDRMAEAEGTGWLRRRKGRRDRLAEGTGWQKRKGRMAEAEGNPNPDQGNAAEGTGWQKQKRKDWNLMAPEGTC